MSSLLSTKPRLLLLLFLLLNILLAGKVLSQPKQGCPGKCGSLRIDYPFGLTEECSLDESFLITCRQSSGKSPTPFLWGTNVAVLSISLNNGQLHVSTKVASDCYNSAGNLTNWSNYSFYLSPQFHISPSKNNLYAVGCDTYGFIGINMDHLEENTTTGCISMCRSRDDPFLTNGVCDNGIGCCKGSIPSEVSSLAWYSGSVLKHTSVHDFNPCGYVFVAEEGAYEFNKSDLTSFPKKTFAAVVDWTVGNKSCEEAKKSTNLESFACKSEHSECNDSDTGVGYRCLCSHGYQGNPYLTGSGGCQDVNECLEPNICNENATCINLDGGFKCPCRDGYEGDGTPGGIGCHLKVNGSLEIKTLLVITLSVSISVFGLLLGSSYIYWGVKKRELIKMREKFFQQNGGLLLQQQIARHGASETAKIFTAKELMKATNNFEECRVLGQGGHGTVYKGVLPNGTVVAVKKSKICGQNQIEEFINEVIVLSQINHRNVVKLLGCCLETEVPLLVYEFITNGTLSEHIHGTNTNQSSKLSWTMRWRIATEAAGALAYLHSATSTPIIHRDVKTTNILLDHNLTAKIADFGASRLVPLYQSHLTTLVQGTLGYLDPEYFQTSQLTEKSDVYSFGVVLAELLTSKKALSFDRPENFRNLSMYFVSSMKEGQLLHIVDKLMLDDDAKVVEQIVQVADLAKRCLSVKGEDRPSMKEVAMELEGLGITEKHAWRNANNMSLEETEYLLGPFYPANVAYIGHHVGGIGTTPVIESMNQISSSLDYCGR